MTAPEKKVNLFSFFLAGLTEADDSEKRLKRRILKIIMLNIAALNVVRILNRYFRVPLAKPVVSNNGSFHCNICSTYKTFRTKIRNFNEKYR